jgi:hypothetical protein
LSRIQPIRPGKPNVGGQASFSIFSGGVTTLVAPPDPPAPSGENPTIVYNSKAIILPRGPWKIDIDPKVARDVNPTIRGVIETLLHPRMDVFVHLEFEVNDDLTSRTNLENFWQWASHGEPFYIARDPLNTVRTTLTADTTKGQSVINVLSVGSVAVGGRYVLRGGPHYQTVAVTEINGNDLTIADPLNFDFESDSTFRSELFWEGIIRDPNAPTPIRYRTAKDAPPEQAGNPDWFDLVLEFYEKVD